MTEDDLFNNSLFSIDPQQIGSLGLSVV